MAHSEEAGAVAAGMLDCLESADPAAVGAPFNGQERRVELFQELLDTLEPQALIETGSFRGSTTRYLAESSGLPVHSVEIDPHSYGIAVIALRDLGDQVDLHHADSRDFLTELVQNPAVTRNNALFYLDAHWGAELPLAGEVELIFRNWTESVALIDDFEVPGTDYGFDDYGDAGVLTASYLLELVDLDLHLFYPTAPLDSETGARRGCTVLCSDDATSARLHAMDTLRPA